MFRRSYSLDMGKVKSTDLNISLYELQEDVKRLQGDLDAEREAAATSAIEAMAAMLKLQVEKAMIAMEVNQYQRMAEERMLHDEMSLRHLENLNFKKEDEIKNLKFMLNDYKSKLKSLGYIEFDRSQKPFPKLITEIPVVNEEFLDSRRRQEDKNSQFLEQIKKLDEKFQESVSMGKEKGLFKSEFLGKKMSKKSLKPKKHRSFKGDNNVQGSCSVMDSVFQDELHELKERIEKLELERYKEDMNLQREVDQEINSVEEDISSEQSVMESSRTTLKLDNTSVLDVQEAMLNFWL